MRSSDALKIPLFIHRIPNFNHFHDRSKCLCKRNFITIGQLLLGASFFFIVVVCLFVFCYRMYLQKYYKNKIHPHIAKYVAASSCWNQSSCILCLMNELRTKGFRILIRQNPAFEITFTKNYSTVMNTRISIKVT